MLPADKVGTWKQLKDMKVLKVLKDMKVLKVLKVLKVPKQRYRTGRETQQTTHKFLLVIINRHVTSSDTTLR